MYEANFEFNTNTVEFDSEINTKNIQADLVLTLNVIPDASKIKADIEELKTNKQDVLTAGANIQINDNVISATDTTYTAGTGISIVNGVISNEITIDDELSTTSENPVQNKVITTELNKKIEGITSSDVTTALGFTPYNATNPSGYITSSAIGNGTLTIQKNGINVATFGANQSGNATANISVPTTLTDLATTTQMSAINSGINATKVSQIASNTSNIGDIQDLIPTQATANNQLADKNFVNSSIATNTANFIGTFNSVAELEAYSGTLTNNDYAFVAITDTAGNTLYDRYKYNGTAWVFEYELNNSSFTAAQWAALNSTATTTKISQISTNTTAITGINSTISGYGNIVTHNVSEFATASQGAKADTALQNGDDISELNNDAGYITGITSSDVTTALGYTPYNSSNPNGYTSNAGTVTSVNNVSPVNGNVTINIPTVPTNVSAFTNDSGYITSSGLSGYQTTSNLVTSVSASSTDAQYPSAKCVYDNLDGKANASDVIKKDGGSSVQTISLSSGTGTTALGVKSRSTTSSYISFTSSSAWLGSIGVNSSKKPVFYNGTGYTLATTDDIPTIATSVSSSSTNAETVGAKLFYDTVGNIETLLSQV